MKICAVILDYHGAERTATCIRSLLNQEIATVLVVDNSADSAATTLLEASIEQIREDGPNFDIHVLKPGRNLGFSAGVNYAIGHSLAEAHDAYLVLNNDATASPGMVQLLRNRLIESKAGIVAPAIMDAGNHPVKALFYNRLLGLQTVKLYSFSFPYLSGCCLLVRKELIAAQKLFNEDFFMYGEDTELGWRLIRSGNPLLIEETALVHHDGSSSSRHGQLFYEYHTARAHVLLSLKALRHPAEAPCVVLCKSVVLALRAAARCIRYRSLNPALGFLLAYFPLRIRAGNE